MVFNQIKFPFLIFLTVISSSAIAQDDKLGEQIEKSAEFLETDQDYTEIFDDLMELSRNPVNINKTDEESVNTIPYLSVPQRKGLLDFLKTYGEVLSIYELQSIPGFDSVLIKKIQPFISISSPSKIPKPTPHNLVRFGHHDLLLRYEQVFPRSRGFLADDSVKVTDQDACYLGSPQRYYFRYTYNWFDKIKIGIAGEKDPGEQFFLGAQSSGMDYYAAYLSLNDLGILKKLIIGNFRVSWGQGLTFGSGLSLGSVPGFQMNIPMAAGIRPGLGMNEGSYLRGLAATLKIKKVEISGFASYHPRDATIVVTDTISSTMDEISSLVTTGYHRNAAELAKRNALTEFICGGNVSISMALSQQLGFKTGITGIYSRFSSSITPKTYPYNQFGFRGNENFNLGLDVQLRYKRFYLFGEVSRSRNRGMAWLTGVTITPDPRICITLIYRNYQPSYQNMFSNAFGQNSLNANERGIYAALSASIHPKFNLSAYLDLFTFPWMKYRVDSPSQGHEFGAMATWLAAGNVMIGIRYYQKNVRGNGPETEDQLTSKLTDFITRSYRFNIDWLIDSRLSLKTRIEVKEAGESALAHRFGYLVYQEASVKSFKWMENITLRFSLFDIPDYASRIYVYEPEVLYGFSVPAYQGKGIRGCMVLKFGITTKIDLWVKGGISFYTDRSAIGTGLDETDGNARSELTGQLLLKL